MSEAGPKKREAPISYRPPQLLRAAFEERVAASGISAGAFITPAVFGSDAPRAYRRMSADQAAVARVLAELACVRDRLDRLDGAIADPAERAALDAALTDLTEIRALCFQALGRQP